MTRQRMNSLSLLIWTWLLAGCSTSPPPTAPQVEYRVIDLGTLGGASGQALAINDRGQITGTAQTARGASHAFLYSAGRMRDLGVLPGQRASTGAAINNGGQVVGWAETDPAHSRAFLCTGGRLREILPQAIEVGQGLKRRPTWTQAHGINDRGEVVGALHLPGENGPRAFLCQDGSLRLVTPPGSTGDAINRS